MSLIAQELDSLISKRTGITYGEVVDIDGSQVWIKIPEGTQPFAMPSGLVLSVGDAVKVQDATILGKTTISEKDTSHQIYYV